MKTYPQGWRFNKESFKYEKKYPDGILMLTWVDEREAHELTFRISQTSDDYRLFYAHPVFCTPQQERETAVTIMKALDSFVAAGKHKADDVFFNGNPLAEELLRQGFEDEGAVLGSFPNKP